MFRRFLIPTAGLLLLCAGAFGSVVTNNPSLPPPGTYVSPTDFHTYYPTYDIHLVDISHTPFLPGDRHQTGVIGDEIETFNSQVKGDVCTGGCSTMLPVQLTGPVQVLSHGSSGQTTGSWNTEMLSLDLSGGGVMIRESPTLQSLGHTSIQDIGGGLFRIDSFFDVFTELSLDGGATWAPSQGSTRVDLVPYPEPATFLLLGSALIGIGVARKRFKR